MIAPKIKLFNIINYVSPGTKYYEWVQLKLTEQTKQSRSGSSYDWFDNVQKLDHRELPPYRCWYTKQKTGFFLRQSSTRNVRKKNSKMLLIG